MRTLRLALLVTWVAWLGGCLDRDLKALNPCLVSSVSRKVSVNNIDKVDLLFMVDNSGSMAEEQNSLRQQFPHMITVLTTGMRMANDPNPFPAAKDLHLGVVSSDLGAVGQVNVEGCNANGGDDARLQNLPHGTACQATYPTFLSYVAMRDTPMQIATDFGCIAQLGTGGCGYEQQLEAPFKALWPSVYQDEKGNVVASPYTFIGATPAQSTGRGDLPAPEGSLGFVRNDPALGLSLLAIVVVTDEEDCSSQKTDHFKVTMDANDPLSSQGPQIRCFMNKQNLYPIDRYIEGFRKLRPGNEKLVVFAGIVGVPPDLVDEKARAAIDFLDPAQRNAYYDKILADRRMQETVQGGGRNPQGASMTPSCQRRDRTNQTSTAYPPRRIVEVAKGMGENGVIQSICQDDFGPAMDAIIEVIARQLGAVCLPRPLVRKSDGLVSCDVVWELPPADKAPAAAPTACAALPYLEPVDSGREATNDRGGVNCKVAQLPVMKVGAAPVGAGWYYDDFSDGVKSECSGTQRQRVSFSNAAKPPNGIVVKLECLNETQRYPVLGKDISTSVAQPELGSPCVDVKLGNKMVSGDAACVVTRTSGADHSLFCHPDLNYCVKSCQSSNDCPAAWECDTRPESTEPTKGRGFCVNPTCGAN